tara:strand:- start:232 stop:621 length:390 start_codon:yes stop_codon:yes gene_type:complete
MVGVIWLIQLIHYPSFEYISTKRYFEFQKLHMNRVSIIVMPVMLLESISGAYILFYIFPNDKIYAFSIVLLVIIWIITGLYFSKVHSKLLHDNSLVIKKKLVQKNWSRTIIWTIRLVLIFWLTNKFALQ